MSTRRKFSVIGCSLVGALVIVPLLFGVTAYRFKQYQAMLENLPEKATPIMIAITSPHTGQSASADTPLLVHVNASALEPLLTLELWANGQIVGIQAAPSANGINPFTADFGWTPSDPGTYTLVARGLQVDDQSADSAAVVVIVGPTEKNTDEGGDTTTGQSIPISNGGSGDQGSIPLPSSPAPPDASDSVGPAQILDLSLVDWISSFSDSLLSAPELTAVAAGCGATLSIHDLSQNEDGFILFRMTETVPTLTKIATLDGQSEFEWLTYTDQSYSPSNSYLVRAFDGVKMADSNIVFVKDDAASCQPDAVPPLLSIKLTSLKTDSNAEMVYCYKSLNGVDWSRWPVVGFFTPGADGFDIQDQADVLLLNELDGKVLTLDLECWGWLGSALKLLGKLHHNNFDAGQLGDIQLIDGDLIVGLELGGEVHTLGHDSDPAITDPKMPKVFALVAYGPEACKEHLPGKGKNLLESLLFCSWFPNYNEDQGQSQPYLVWYVMDGSCANGEGDVCHSLHHYVTRAKLYGGQVGFHVYPHEYDVSTEVTFGFPIDTTPHDRTQYVIMPPETCTENLFLYTVRMFYQGGPNDPDYSNLTVESPDSNEVGSVFNCPPPSEVKLDVIFDTLQIQNLDDGGGGGDDLEIYASVVAHGQNPGSGSALNLGAWGWSGSECADDTLSVSTEGTLGPCPAQLEEGNFSFSELALCTSNTYKDCVGDYALNNNRIQITVGEGSQIRVAIHAMDFDDTSPDDHVCQAETIIGPQSIFGWMDFTISSSMSQGDNGNASCKVFFHIQPSQ